MSDMFEEVTRQFDESVREAGFCPLSMASERHGSWEWVALRKDTLNRFVILALTEGSRDGMEVLRYEGEVWAGADDGARFVRLLVSTFGAKPDDLTGNSFLRNLADRLTSASKRADSLGANDLTETYLRRHSRA